MRDRRPYLRSLAEAASVYLDAHGRRNPDCEFLTPREREAVYALSHQLAALLREDVEPAIGTEA